MVVKSPDCLVHKQLAISIFIVKMLLDWSILPIKLIFSDCMRLARFSFVTTTQQTQNICITFIQFWNNVEDVGPTLYKCYTTVLCLLGCMMVVRCSRPLIIYPLYHADIANIQQFSSKSKVQPVELRSSEPCGPLLLNSTDCHPSRQDMLIEC